MEKKFNSMIALNHKPCASVQVDSWCSQVYRLFNSYEINLWVYTRKLAIKVAFEIKLKRNHFTFYLLLFVYDMCNLKNKSGCCIISHINERRNIVAYQKYHVTSFQRCILKRCLMKAKTFLEYIYYKDVTTLRIT